MATASAAATARLVSALADAGAPVPAHLFVPVHGSNAQADLTLAQVRARLDAAGVAYRVFGDQHRTGITVADGPATYTLSHVRNGG